MTSLDSLVLLFYDGFELKAEEQIGPWLVAQVRRPARYLWHRLKRDQIWSGRYMTFCSLHKALRSADLDVRVNDFSTARRYPSHPIAVAGYPSILDKVARLENPRLIGPGLFDSPLQRPDLFDDPRNRLYVKRAQWERDMYAPYYGDHIRSWYRGYDVSDYEDVRSHPKTTDVLIYDKIYHDRDYFCPRTIETLTRILDRQGLSYEMIRYGKYYHKDYLAALRRSRTMAFFAHSEIQGNAQLQASAMNMPIFAWDEGIWLDPLAKELSPEPVPCTSVTHFDERCGARFKIDDLKPRWEEFWHSRDQFAPRDYVAENLTLSGAAALYMKHYREVGGGAAAKLQHAAE